MSAPALLDPYAGLDPGDELWLRQQTDRIRAVFRRTAEGMIEIGEIIAGVKARLGHGYFLPWVAVVGISAATALRLMQVAEVFGQGRIRHADAFEPTALYVLAQPQTPPEVREKAYEYAAEGREITAEVVRAIIRALRPDAPAEPRPARSTIDRGALLLLIPDGQREAHFTLDLSLDPDGDLIVGVGGETGRDLAAVLTQLAERVRNAPSRTATHDDRDPALLDWCDAIAGGVAREKGFRRDDPRWDDVRDAGRQALVECCRKFDPQKVRPDSTEEDAFRGWAHPTIRRECVREADRLRNGGLYHTKRPELAAPTVGRLTDEGE